MFNEKLRSLRKQAGMSQEKLAEKLNVSRQAVTKWETGAGLPETESLVAISALFGITVDELLTASPAATSAVSESVTEYDVDETKKFDIKLGSANRVYISGVRGEKLRVRLRSESINNLSGVLKIKIDDGKKALDIDLKNVGAIPEAVLKNELTAFIELPEKYIGQVEVYATARRVEIDNIGKIEFDGKAENICIARVERAELNCGCDADIKLKDVCGYLELNQIACTSRLGVPDGAKFRAIKCGIKTKIIFEGEPFDDKQAENAIELNGINTELTIYKIF